jgi:uridine kinase
MTVRERYKYDEIGKDIIKLIRGEKILKKIYDPYSRGVINEGCFSLDGSRCLIIDGVSTLDIEEIRNISNIKIYVEVNEDIRKKRFFNFYKWKDLSDEDIEHLYQRRLVDEVPFIEISKRYADVIVKV